MGTLDNDIFEFGDFRLVPGEGLLLRHGEPIPLSIKAFATLVLLVERHGHLVQKSELLEEIWKDTCVEEAAVSRCVWNVRHALGDASKERFIQTVPRRGYRFIFPVSVVNNVSGAFRLSDLGNVDDPTETPFGAGKSATNGYAQGSSATAVAAEDPEMAAGEAAPGQQVRSEPRYDLGRMPSWATYAGVAVLLVVGAALYFVLAGPGDLGKAGVTRVAVLPLVAMDAQTGNPVYHLGIPEALILKLAADKKLAVRQLNAVRGYGDVNKNPVEAGREQKVDYVLSGNYQIANGKIRVTAQLYDVATGNVEGTFTSDSDAADSFVAQDAIVNSIGNKLLARFGSDATEFRSNRGTSNEEAYRNFQQAMTLLDQQRPGSIVKAREYLDRAVELDPNYAKAWAGKAYAYSVMLSPGRPSSPENLSDKYEKSIEAAKRALAIDQNLSEAYTSLCENKFAYEYNFDEAEKDCKRAIELDRNSPLAHRLYSILLTSRGRSDESFAEIKTAMELEPVSLQNQRIFANALYYARRYGEAVEVYKRLFDLNPDASATHLFLIRSLERSGRESEAFDILIKLLVLQKKDNATIERFRAAYTSSGWHGVLNERIKMELQEDSPQYSVVAEYYGLLGDKGKAFEYLEKNSQKRGWMKMFFRVDPRFDSLHDDPRFGDLVRRVEGK